MPEGPQKDPKRPKTALLGHKQIWWLQTGGTVWSKGGTSQGSSPVMHSNNFAGQGGPSWGARELPKDPKRPFWAFWSSIWPPMGPPDQRKGSIALPWMCPNLFHLYSTLFCQFGATRPAYGSKKDHFGPFGAFLGFFKGPPTARLTREMVPVHHPGCALTCSTLVSCCSTSSGTPDLLMAPNGDFG